METAIRKNTGWRLFVQTILGRAYPRVVGMSREKSWLFFDIFLPMLSVSAYVFVYRALKAPEEYIGFVVVGGAMTAFWMNILWSMSSQLYWEKETGNLALYIMSPANLMGILLGMALGGMVSTAQRALGIILLGSLAFKVPVRRRRFLAAAAGVLPGNDRPLRHGYDDCLAFPAAQPRSLAHRQPGAGADLPGSRFLLPHQKFQLLGGGSRFHHSADPGAGRHAPTGVPVRRSCSAS